MTEARHGALTPWTGLLRVVVCEECLVPWAYQRKKDLAMKNVTDATFEAEVLKAAGPVLVDFWAEWCGPCRQIAPALEELSKELGAKITVAKINIDENPATPGKYGVRGIPTLMIFKGGQVAATKIGALPKSKLFEWVEGSL
jgi:thioredoxin 1